MRVVIVGGGIVGAGIAWRLAKRGVDVLLLDDRTRPGMATSAAAGMLAPLAEAHQPGPFLELGLESLERYPGFIADVEAETGYATGYARAGKLIAALTAAEADDLAAAFAWWLRAERVHVELIDAARAHTLEPALAPDVRAAVLIRDDHRVDNVQLAEALTRAATLAGARIIHDRAMHVTSSNGGVTGVQSVAGYVEADAVVIAAGAWSGTLEGLPRVLPVRPVRGQMLALRPSRPLFARTLAGSDAYLVPRTDGRVIVGSTMEEAGYDATTTPDALGTLRTAAVRLVPALADAARAGAWAGFRPATPDDLPVLGPDPLLNGLYYATGHFRNGILLAPVTADAVSAAIVGESDIDLAPYSIARFDAASGVRLPPSESPAEVAPDPASSDLTCDLCGSPMYEVHCKVICRSCGYKRDCTDLW